ncbi:MAG: tetratricopeptide repeat protein [Bryobacterales bacterium]|nr:tetratricopeptide repeat protein [Bryobacterales bacterium]
MRTGIGTLRFASWLRTLAAVASVLASCQGTPDPPEDLSPLPLIRLEAMSPGARATLEPAQDRAIRSPRDSEANGALAMALHAYELREGAVAAYRRAATLAPNEGRWQHYLGLVLAELGQHSQAVEHFRRAAAIKPDSVAARIWLGESLLSDGRPAESQSAFEQAIELDPSSAAAHYGLGRARDFTGDSDTALRSYLRAIELTPEAGAVRYSLAMLYQSLGRANDAKQQLELAGGDRQQPPINDPLVAALRNVRRDRQKYLQEGLRLESEGLLADAVRAYGRAARADPRYAQPHINLVAAYGKLERLKDASRHYDRALALAPDSEELHVNWGTLMAQHDRLEEAAASFRRALEINPHAGGAHADLAWVLQQSGKHTEALEHYRLAVQYDPANREANFELARDLIRNDRVEEAIQHLLRTLEPVDERTPTYLYGLADAYLRIGESRKAVEYLRRALELANEMGQSELARNLEEDLRAVEAAGRR